MRRKIIEGHCYKRRTQKGLFRMKKKSREAHQASWHNNGISDFYGEAFSTELIKELRAKLKRKREEQAAESNKITRLPGGDPGVWLA